MDNNSKKLIKIIVADYLMIYLVAARDNFAHTYKYVRFSIILIVVDGKPDAWTKP